MAGNAVAQGAPRGGGFGRAIGGFFRGIVTFYHDVVAEMRKVTWPERAQVRQATIAIIIFVLLIGLVIFLLDLVLQGVLVRLIPSLFGRG
jgi:preprotein translocase subunit SecE